MQARQFAKIAGVMLLLIAVAYLFMTFFEHLPIEGTTLAMDWRGLWMALQSGTLTYGTGLRNPPWSILPLFPLGLLTFRASWGLLLAATLYVVWADRPTIEREKAGMLIAASLLLSPYAAGNSLLTVLAVGIIPLLQSRPAAGAILVALADLPYLFLPAHDIQFRWSIYYWTAMLIVTWGIFLAHTRSKLQSAACNLLYREEGQ